jgi:DNA mismatch repair ATPase MutS
MKAHLLLRDQDFDPEQPLPSNTEALIQDLELPTVFRAMGGEDEFLREVAKRVILSAMGNDQETIRYRQAVLKDCLKNTAIVERLYGIALGAIEAKRKQWLGLFGSFPGSILSGAVNLLDMLTEKLGELKELTSQHAAEFDSEGFTAFFQVLRDELADDYFSQVKTHLRELRFDRGVVISAQLGKGNLGINYMLRESIGKKPGWIRRLVGRRSKFTFFIADRDEAGARALGELQDRGINLVANTVAQSSDHVVNFFITLRTELAFYLGCVNLHRILADKGVRLCYPNPTPIGSRRHACSGLRDVGLALSLERSPVANDLAADGKNIVVVTGANQGGKSTFLRSIGVAQCMMQAGMFAAAESFEANLCRQIFTHYKREEDKTMTSGKFDEEMSRMSIIANAIVPESLFLFNESFAATNEREGSEIARQIVRALLESRVKIFYVTHLYQFSNLLWKESSEDSLFMAAERRSDGVRTFKLVPSEPSETSFGVDLYREIFKSLIKALPVNDGAKAPASTV